jgi:hypothetical protein
MRLINNTQDEMTQAQAYWENLSLQNQPVMHQAYHELADKPVVEVDALAQLHANIETLSDLQGRLSFVMREVKYLMKA